MYGWCPYKEGSLKDMECHFDGYCEDGCPVFFERFKKSAIDTFGGEEEGNG